MSTEPQIYAIGTCALGIHTSFLKTLSIYYYFLLNSPEVHRTPNGGVPRTVAKKILRTTPALLVPQVSSCPGCLCPRCVFILPAMSLAEWNYVEVVEFIPKGGNNEPFKLFIQNKPNLLNAQMNVTSVTIKDYEEIRPPNPAKTNPIQTQLVAA